MFRLPGTGMLNNIYGNRSVGREKDFLPTLGMQFWLKEMVMYGSARHVVSPAISQQAAGNTLEEKITKQKTREYMEEAKRLPGNMGKTIFYRKIISPVYVKLLREYG
ncbi:hypothetical protein CXU21_00970 [Akkermansia muciniphila]|nr:hypothetical protein CXU21_00970 [Akkermansia muciniphila]